MDQILNELRQLGEVETDVPMSAMTTLRIGGKAKYVIYPETEIALDAILHLMKKYLLPYKVFGKGSNMICSDENYDGAVIRLDRHFNDYYFQGSTAIAQAGCSIITLSYEAMKNGLSGLEFANGIPATVGGAAYMNAGAYKSSVSDVIDSVFVCRNDKLEWVSNKECEYSYRSSIFQKHPDWIILAVKMNLIPKDSAEINDLMNRRRERRLASQPLDYPSAGSVFRNPDNAEAWKLIEGIGYRGKTVGGATVSSKHSNFIINSNHATAHDFIQLVTEIQEKVKEKYGIELRMEVEKFNWR